MTVPPVAAASAWLHGSRATILMLHRFQNGFPSVDGFPPEDFRRILTWLRRNNYELLDLESLIRRLMGEGPPLRRAVSFTIDDGYSDQFEVATPLLAEFDAPANVFLTTGFLDGKVWHWWDQVEYLVHQAKGPALNVRLDGTELRYDLAARAGRARAVTDFTERCKWVRDPLRVQAIQALEAAANTPLPSSAPPCYRSMSWDEARKAEQRGVRFGPQTVTHPILSRVDDQQAEWEITASWYRLREEVSRPLPVFCFPNGLVSDFGEREIEVIRRLGFLGALTCRSGYADPTLLAWNPEARFRLPRFATPQYLPRLVQFVSGLERLKDKLRRTERI